MPFTMELKNEAGRVSGRIDCPEGVFTGEEGTFADGKLSITLAAPGGPPVQVIGTLKGDSLTGEWRVESQGTGTFQCARVQGATGGT